MSGDAAMMLSEPLTTGTEPPSLIHAFVSVSSSTPVVKNFFAVSFCSAVALAEIERY